MTPERTNEATIFNAARKIESDDKRRAFLDDACGNDSGLRGRVEILLAAFLEESQFLEQPAPALEQTVDFGSDGKDLVASLDAGLAATFGDESAVVIGNTNHSVLKSMSATLDEVPRISLRAPRKKARNRFNVRALPRSPSSRAIVVIDWMARSHAEEWERSSRDAIPILEEISQSKCCWILTRTNQKLIQRFVEEAQIGGQLQHPGIAPVYELVNSLINVRSSA